MFMFTIPVYFLFFCWELSCFTFLADSMNAKFRNFQNYADVD